jgi:CRP-like cAMP-binding protein
MTDSDSFKTRSFRKGETLLEEGELHDDVFLIVKGKVEVRKGLLDDFPYVFGIKGAGDIIGEMAAFDNQPHMASVIALEDTIVTVMSRDEFQRRLSTMDPIVRGAILAVVRRAREMAELLVEKKKTTLIGSRRKK